MNSLSRRSVLATAATAAIAASLPAVRPSTIGGRFRLARERRGLSLEQVARVGHGVTPELLARWEADNGQPDLIQGVHLAELYGVHVRELARGV